MPSIEHELALDFFRNQPRLAPELLRTVFGVPVPDAEKASLGEESFSETNPAEYRCDATVMVGDPSSPDLGIVVEVQLQYDKRKIYTWPAYLALLRARRKCPVTLLVWCPDEATAQACAKPIDLGHQGWVLRPLVFSPDRLPAVTDPEKARELPELAVLSAPVHANGPDATAVLTRYLEVIEELPDDIAGTYRDYAESWFSDSARKILEEIMATGTYTYTSRFAHHYFTKGEAKGKAEGEAKGRAEGEAKGVARAALRVLAKRGIEVSDEVRERITSCTDLNQLDLWAERAVTVDTAEQLFD